jgi:hypothetical protein
VPPAGLSYNQDVNSTLAVNLHMDPTTSAELAGMLVFAAVFVLTGAGWLFVLTVRGIVRWWCRRGGRPLRRFMPAGQEWWGRFGWWVVLAQVAAPFAAYHLTYRVTIAPARAECQGRYAAWPHASMGAGEYLERCLDETLDD